MAATGSENRWTIFGYSKEKVYARFTEAAAAAATAFSNGAQAISNLLSTASSLTLISTRADVAKTAVTFPSTEYTMSPPTIGSLGSFQDPTGAKVTNPTLDPTFLTYNKPGAIADIPASLAEPGLTIDSSLTAFTKPTAVVEPSMDSVPVDSDDVFSGLTLADQTISSGGATYSSSLLTALQASLLQQINDGSVGLTPAIEAAIWARESERAALEHTDTKDRIAADWSKRGYPIPTGMMTALLAQADIDYSNKRLDVSRDIAIKSFELAVQNSHFVIEQIVSVEAHLISWANWVATRIMEASKAQAQANIDGYKAKVEQKTQGGKLNVDRATVKVSQNRNILSLLEARVNYYAAQLRAEADRYVSISRSNEVNAEIYRGKVDYQRGVVGLHGVRVENFKAQNQGEAERINSITRGFATEIENYKAQIQAESESFTAYSKGQEGQAQLFKAINDYYNSKYSLTAKSIELHIQDAIAEANTKLKNEEITGQFLQIMGQIRAECQKAAGMVAEALHRAELGTIHVGADIHGSNQASYGYRAPASISEAL